MITFPFRLHFSQLIFLLTEFFLYGTNMGFIITFLTSDMQPYEPKELQAYSVKAVR